MGNGEKLRNHEMTLIESRFRTEEWCDKNVPKAVRLFHRHCDVDKYNAKVISDPNECIAKDSITGYT